METYRQLKQAPEMRRIGLLGGTFDPIHYGHLVIAEEVCFALQLEKMVFIPSGQPPHKLRKDVTPVYQRVAMLERATTSNPHFSISRIELERGGPSYSVDTVRELRTQWGTNAALYFVIGWDSLEELYTWHDAPGLLAQVTHLVAVRRPGYEDDAEYNKLLEARLPGIMQRLLVVPAPQLAIAATELRQRVSEGRPIKYQTPEAVEEYILEQGLYRHR